ncbi:MAG: hypothetical protein GTO40_16290, partial [Deltaproteobacteria bacterium]|nr:hypothetical protein [Deltaproteobacteria bacterium]
MNKRNAPTLKKLLNALPSKEAFGDLDLKIKKIEYDSRRVQLGDLFVAIKGFSVDGHQY